MTHILSAQMARLDALQILQIELQIIKRVAQDSFTVASQHPFLSSQNRRHNQSVTALEHPDEGAG